MRGSEVVELVQVSTDRWSMVRSLGYPARLLGEGSGLLLALPVTVSHTGTSSDGPFVVLAHGEGHDRIEFRVLVSGNPLELMAQLSEAVRAHSAR